LADGRLAAMALSVEAFAEDCSQTAVVISPREAPGACAALLLDRKAWRRNGAMSLRWTGERFEEQAARPAVYDRPWARPPKQAAEPASPTSRPVSRDATPREDDMEPGDSD
jgi:competence protein ComEC